MKKSKILILSTIVSLNLSALDLDKAVNIALNNNLDIKSSQYDYLTSVQNVKASNSTLLPKLGLGYSYNTTNEPIFNANQSERTALSATATYNLFNGFKDEANQNSSKYLSKSSKYSLQAKKQDIVLNVKTAYINHLNAKNALKTYNSAYKLFEEQFRDSKNRYDQGLTPKNELLQVQVNMQKAKQNIVSAKGNVKVTKAILSNYLGGLDLTNETIESLDDKQLSFKSYEINKLENRSEIKALKMSMKSYKEQEIASKSAYYPKLDASIAHNKYFDTFSLKEYKAAPVDNQTTAGLNASWNLYNGGYDNSQLEKSKIAYLKSNNMLEKTRLDIKLQYENAKSNLEVANDNLETSKLSLQQAQENYQIVKNRFDGGIDTATDLTDANYLLTQARQAFNKAYFDKYLAIATLDRIFELNEY